MYSIPNTTITITDSITNNTLVAFDIANEVSFLLVASGNPKMVIFTATKL